MLAFLLNKFLYKPLLKILSDRQSMVKETVENAKSMAEAKRNLDKELEEERIHANKKANEILGEARAKAEILRVEAVGQLEKELVAMKNKALAAIEKERSMAMNQAKSELASVVILAAEKVLEREVKSQDSMRLAEEALKQL